jgi:hypothetical protein
MCGCCRVHLDITSSEDGGVVCGESLGMRNVKPSCSGASGGCVLPLMRFGRGQLMRLSVGMTGMIWLSSSVGSGAE